MSEQVINRYNVFIDSSKRRSGDSNYFNILLSRPFVLTSENSYFRMRVGSVEMPFAFQQVNNNNHTLYIRLQRQAIDATFSITFANGNYNILTLLDAFKALLVDYIQTTYGLTFNFNFSYNRNTGQATMYIIGNDNIETILTFKYSLNMTIGKMFGFTADALIAYDGNNTSTVAISTQHVNVNPVSYLLVRSDSLNQAVNYESLVEYDVLSDIICKLQLRATPGSYIYYDGSLELNITLTNKIIDVISLYITDSLTYTFDLGGLEWSCRLTFEEVERHRTEDSSLIFGNPDVQRLESEKENLINELTKIRNKIDLKK